MRCVLLFGMALVGCAPSVVARPVVPATPAVAPPAPVPKVVATEIDTSTSVVATPSIPDAILAASTPYKTPCSLDAGACEVIREKYGDAELPPVKLVSRLDETFGAWLQSNTVQAVAELDDAAAKVVDKHRSRLNELRTAWLKPDPVQGASLESFEALLEECRATSLELEPLLATVGDAARMRRPSKWRAFIDDESDALAARIVAGTELQPHRVVAIAQVIIARDAEKQFMTQMAPALEAALTTALARNRATVFAWAKKPKSP